MGSPAVETATDLKQLPLRALVAYAARCARRVQAEYAPDPANADSAACIEAIDSAIRLAEQVASGEEPDADVFAQVEEAAVKAMILVSGEENGNSSAAYAANAAYAAIDAAAAVRSVADGEDLHTVGEKVADAAAIAFDAAVALRDDVSRAARLDWEMLHRMHLGKFPAVGEKVNPAENGILGPLFRKGAAGAKKKAAAKPTAEEPTKAEPAKRQSTSTDDLAATAKLREAAELLRARQDDLCAFEAKLEEERKALEADRERLKSEQSALETERADLGRQAAQLDIDRARGINDAKAAEAAAEAAARLEQRQKEFE